MGLSHFNDLDKPEDKKMSYNKNWSIGPLIMLMSPQKVIKLKSTIYYFVFNHKIILLKKITIAESFLLLDWLKDL